MILLRRLKDRAKFRAKFPGIEPNELARLARFVFWRYSEECVELGYGRPGYWDDPIMLKLVRWKMKTAVGLDEDKDAELGVAAERTVLRWVKEQVEGFDIVIPLGSSDYQVMLKVGPVKFWDRQRILSKA